MVAIGGYFGLELHKGEHFHKDALRLNTARNCLEYILRVRKYAKVYIPYYTCEVVLEPIRKCNVDYEFYHINTMLEPETEVTLGEKEAFLYTNYFGIKQKCVQRLSQVYGSRLIVDNAQAFYALPIAETDTFYSARKFFGVADGAYLYIDELLPNKIEQDVSYNRMSHLLKRIDVNAEFGFADFRNNDNSLVNQPIKRMSKLTSTILCSINYDSIRTRRIENYIYLHGLLKDRNKFNFELHEGEVPMVYPYWADNGKELRNMLIANQVYVATYWQNVLKWCSEFDVECEFAKNVIYLPIDQRYNNVNFMRMSWIK